MNVTLRGLTAADVPAWNRLLGEIEEVDRTGEHYNEADLLEEMDNPETTPGKDMVGAFVDGRLVGYFVVFRRAASEDCHKVVLDASVHPGWRGQGVGSELAVAMMRRAREVHAEQHPGVPARYAFRGRSDDAAQERLLASVGLVPERWSFTMRAELTDVGPPGRLPEGLSIEPYDDSMAGALLEAHNAAFLDHPHFTPWTEAMWKHWVTGSRSFRPSLTYVVRDPRDPTRIASYVQTSEYDAHFEATGRREAYVGKVGTLREFRGRGLATTLLQHCLLAYRRAGYDESSLDVDSLNPTGALGIYERAGFAVETRWTDYALTER